MNLVLFIVTIIISFIAVRIGALAFELTGMGWELAKFQALSCFTGTGFTTREAELIASNRQRRRIASYLMILGNAGLVTLIATFANSIRAPEIMDKFSLPFLHLVFPSYILPAVNLVVIAASMYLLYKLFSGMRRFKRLGNFIKKRIARSRIVKPVSFEELAVATGGYGISQAIVAEKSHVAGKKLIDTHLREKGITVLAVERGEKILPNPTPESEILPGDKLVVFGKLESIRKELSVEEEEADPEGAVVNED